ncbi:MAG: AbrB/MazE/SpoVT family DNA-binding domain-containing protein [Candidatus Parvarchaeota archaeon]
MVTLNEKRNTSVFWIRRLLVFSNRQRPSFFVNIPLEYASQVGWRKGDVLYILPNDNKLIIERKIDHDNEK